MRSCGSALLVGATVVLTVVAGFGVATIVGSAAASSPSATTTQTVTFTEKGLPSGAKWWTYIPGIWPNVTSNTTTLTVSEPTGKYQFVAVSPANWSYAGNYQPIAGHFTVGKKPVSVNLTFKWKVNKGRLTIYEQGLPAKSGWCITITNLSATYCGKAGRDIHFVILGGVYDYALSTTAPGYVPYYGAPPREYFGPGVVYAVTFVKSGSD